MENEQSYWDRAMRRRLTRRALLRAGAMAGAGMAAGLSLAGCSSGQTTNPGQAKPGETPKAAQPKPGGVLKIGYMAGRGYLFPGLSSSGTDPSWMLCLGDAVIATGPDGSPDLDNSLAESWKREDDTTLSFKLRQGIKFHDGTDFDAQALKTYWEYLLDPNKFKSFAYRSSIESIKTMDVVDKYTLRCHLSRIDPQLIASLGGHAAIPVSPTAIDKMGPDVNTKAPYTGPFMIKSFTPGGDWVFEKNPNYWRKGLPYFDGITFTEIPDERVRGASLQAGTIDMAYWSTSSDITENLKKDPSLTIKYYPIGAKLIGLNHALAPLDNLKIRQAIACCVDREAILQSVFQGMGQVAKGSFIPPGSWAYTDVSDIQYKFDINQAKQYIKESGLKTPISLKLISGDGLPDRPLTAQLMKGWLTEAGFDTSLEIMAAAEATRRMFEERSYHVTVTSFSTRPDPGAQLDTYCSATALYNAGRDSKDPIALQMDDLLKKGGATYDQAERQKYYQQFQRLQVQNVIQMIQTVYPFGALGWRSNVKGADDIWNPTWGNFRAAFTWKE